MTPPPHTPRLVAGLAHAAQIALASAWVGHAANLAALIAREPPMPEMERELYMLDIVDALGRAGTINPHFTCDVSYAQSAAEERTVRVFHLRVTEARTRANLCYADPDGMQLMLSLRDEPGTYELTIRRIGS